MMPKLAVPASLAAAATGVAFYRLTAPHPHKLVAHPRGVHDPGRLREAFVLGATGATGRQVLRLLLEKDQWVKVTAIGRRTAEVPTEVGLDEKAVSAKLHSIVVADLADVDAVREAWQPSSSATSAEAPNRVFFNCVGTTRAAAGSAAAFQRVEVDVTAAVTQVASERGVKHVSVVSSQGANPNVWVPSELLHPLLYVRTLGRKEEATLAVNGTIQQWSIFRPGALNRLMGDRPHENLLNWLGLGLRVDMLAQAMVRDAESKTPLQSATSLDERQGVVIYEADAIAPAVEL